MNTIPDVTYREGWEIGATDTIVNPGDYFPILKPDDIAYIPLETRLNFLHLEDPSYIDAQYSIGEVLDEAGVTWKWMQDFIGTLDEGIYVGVDSAFPCPDYVRELVIAEADWQRDFDRLPALVAMPDMVEHVTGHGHFWISNILDNIGAKPLVDNSSYPARHFYQKDIMLLIRKVAMNIPPADDRFSVKEITDAVPFGKRWVLNRLELAGYACDERVGRNGLVSFHYSEDAKAFVERLAGEMPEPAGDDWISMYGIKVRLGRKESWIVRRLGNLYDDYSEMIEMRTDALSRPRPHYPISVLRELEAISDYERSLPEIEDHIGVTRAARALHKENAMLIDVIDEAGISLKLRRNKNQVVVECMSPQDFKRLDSFIQAKKPTRESRLKDIEEAKHADFEAYCAFQDAADAVRLYERRGEYTDEYSKAIENLWLARRQRERVKNRLARYRKAYTAQFADDQEFTLAS